MKMHDLGITNETSYDKEAPNPLGPANTNAKPEPMYPSLNITAKHDLGVKEGVGHHTVKMMLRRHTVDHKKGTHSYEFDVHGIAPSNKGISKTTPNNPGIALDKAAKKMSGADDVGEEYDEED